MARAWEMPLQATNVMKKGMGKKNNDDGTTLNLGTNRSAMPQDMNECVSCHCKEESKWSGCVCTEVPINQLLMLFSFLVSPLPVRLRLHL